MTRMTQVDADLFMVLSAMIRRIRVIRVPLMRPLLWTTVNGGATFFSVLHFCPTFFRPLAELMITAGLHLFVLETGAKFPEILGDEESPNRIRHNDHSPYPSNERTSRAGSFRISASPSRSPRAGSGYSGRRVVDCPVARPTTPLLQSKAVAFWNARNRRNGRSPHSNS
jgi:hypothetical protein